MGSVNKKSFPIKTTLCFQTEEYKNLFFDLLSQDDTFGRLVWPWENYEREERDDAFYRQPRYGVLFEL